MDGIVLLLGGRQYYRHRPYVNGDVIWKCSKAKKILSLKIIALLKVDFLYYIFIYLQEMDTEISKMWLMLQTTYVYESFSESFSNRIIDLFR